MDNIFINIEVNQQADSDIWWHTITVGNKPVCKNEDFSLNFIYDGGGGINSNFTWTQLKPCRAVSHSLNHFHIIAH